MQYTGVGWSNTYIIEPPARFTNPPSHIIIVPQGNFGGYLSVWANVYRDSSKRYGLYSGLNWSVLNPTFRITRIPDSIHVGEDPVLYLKQHSIRFNFGIERRLFKKQNMVVQLGGMVDYLSYPKFSADQVTFANTYLSSQLVVGIHFGLGAYIPRTKKRVMLRYTVDQAFGYGFTNSIKHRLNSDIEYDLTAQYSYHHLGVSILIR